jgi:hypothetical protein
MLATVVDTNALFDVIWASLAAGVGGTAAFSVALVGATRFSDMRREGRGVQAVMFGVLGVVSLALCLGAVVYGIVIITSK